ncbi:MAG TPA: thiamine-phosphate kinase [Pseudolabrys sp.]|jgi:thiamine-monophosphate kinase|nr:thiamine-phosphate kinase [Pseudolabrys sp.]
MAALDDISAEDRLIARFFGPIATDPGALGLSDDAAFIKPPPGCDLVLKTDAIVGGVHFFQEDSAQAVASKALRVNLSDLAAKGARPLGFLLSLAIPTDIKEDWLGGFAEGLRGDAVLFGCPLFGGDTDRTPGPVTVSIAMFGSVPEGTMVRRTGAKAGDCVFVTGTIGDAALGVALRGGKAKTWKLNDAQRQHLMSRYLLPQPRNVLAEAIRNHASAAMDISDGLVGDFGKLCRTSGVAADISIASVPVSDAAKTVIAGDAAALELVLTGGDDYEVICTVPNKRVESFRAAAKAVGVPVTELGVIKTGEGARFIDSSGKPLVFKRASFSHF